MPLKDLTGKVFGNLTVLERDGSSVYGGALWLCQCSCGNKVTMSSGRIRNYQKCGRFCGTERKYIPGTKMEDFTGKVVGALTGISYAGRNEDGVNLWLCQCSCGTMVTETAEMVKKTPTCKHYTNPNHTKPKRLAFKDLVVGRKIGDITVLSRQGEDKLGKELYEVLLPDGSKTIYNIKKLRILYNTTEKMDGDSLIVNHIRPFDSVTRSSNKKYQMYLNRAKEKNTDNTLSETDFYFLTSKPCFYCGSPISLGRVGVRQSCGLDRIDNSKGYTPDNVVSSCTRCNMMRRIESQPEFIQRVLRIYSRHVLHKTTPTKV